MVCISIAGSGVLVGITDLDTLTERLGVLRATMRPEVPAATFIQDVSETWRQFTLFQCKLISYLNLLTAAVTRSVGTL